MASNTCGPLVPMKVTIHAGEVLVAETDEDTDLWLYVLNKIHVAEQKKKISSGGMAQP